jgi:hypothetical protein
MTIWEAFVIYLIFGEALWIWFFEWAVAALRR